MAGDKNPDRDFSAGGASQSEIDRSLLDPKTWGEPLGYVELLTSPLVQSRIARLIVQSKLKRSRRGRHRALYCY
jgi:hypothetical protein